MSENQVFDAFCDSVEHFAFINDEIFLPREFIREGVEEDDIEYMQECSNEERQVWAEMLAFRLCDEFMGEQLPQLHEESEGMETEGIASTGAMT